MFKVLRKMQDYACSVLLCLKIVLLCFFSDVKGHARVGYLFMEVSLDWETNQTERVEQRAGNVLMQLSFRISIVCAFRDTEIKINRQVVQNLILFSLFGALFLSFCQHNITSLCCPRNPTCSVLFTNLKGYFLFSNENEHKGCLYQLAYSIVHDKSMIQTY